MREIGSAILIGYLIDFNMPAGKYFIQEVRQIINTMNQVRMMTPRMKLDGNLNLIQYKTKRKEATKTKAASILNNVKKGGVIRKNITTTRGLRRCQY